MVVDKLNVNYSGHQINAEPISVPENSPYKARTVHNRILKEEPSTIEIWQYSDKSGSWLTEEPYTGTVSSTGKFQVDYDGAEDGDMKFRNTILFHAAQANTEWFIWYKSIGDIYDADDFNAKVNKTTGTENNFAALDNAGGIKDSGKKADDFEPKIDPKGTAFNKNFGNAAGTVCEGNDSRLSDARPPTAHKDSHITGGDDIIPNAVPGGNSGLMTGADKQNLDDAVTKKHEHSNKSQLDTYSATTQNLEYWVDGTDGNDNNDGSFEHPFATINKALSSIPQVVNHEIEIIIIYGTYAESINLTGFSGKGSITIDGGNSDVVDIRIENNTLPIELESFNLTGTDEAVIASNNPGYIYLYNIECTSSAGYKDGFSINNCPAVSLEYCTISNHFYGIYSNLSIVRSYSNSGSGNKYGIYAYNGLVYKEDIQPSGTISNEETVDGGQILSSRLAERDPDAVAGNLAEFDANGNPVDSGIDPDTKADKDSDAVEGNLAEFDANGNPVDSGIDPDTKADKDSDAVENNLAKFDSSGNPVDSGIASNIVPIATTAHLTFYVNPSTGNDNNNGSSGSPFKTIAKAVSMIPQIVNHNVMINLANGNYSEGITLRGYMGSGEIFILGNGDHPENVVIAGGISAVKCSVGHIGLYGMETTNTGSDGIYLAYCSSYFTIESVLCDTTGASNDGVYAIGCPTVYIKYSTFSNCWAGISAVNGTTVISANNGGANNDIGLYANAATIMKRGAQPGGTTAESATNGGEIR